MNKRFITILMSLELLMLSVCGGLSGAYAEAEKNSIKQENSPEVPEEVSVYFNRGGDRQVCKDFYKLLLLPENNQFLFSRNEIEDLDKNEKIEEFRKARSIYIPNTSFNGFSEVNWKDLPKEQREHIAKKFSVQMNERLKSSISAEYSKHYKIQETNIDMNEDGTPETIYRTVGLNDSSEKDNYLNDFILVHFDKVTESEGLYRRAQLVLYKKKPVFISRGISLSEVMVEPALEDEEILQTIRPSRKFIPLGCTFSSVDNRYLGD